MESFPLHEAVERGVNEGDVDGLVGLYEPDARMVREDGSVAVGLDEIRELYRELVAYGGRIRVETRSVVEAADIALLSNRWSFVVDDVTLPAVSAEVARRQPDGTWRYTIDHPYAVTDGE